MSILGLFCILFLIGVVWVLATGPVDLPEDEL